MCVESAEPPSPPLPHLYPHLHPTAQRCPAHPHFPTSSRRSASMSSRAHVMDSSSVFALADGGGGWGRGTGLLRWICQEDHG